MNHLKENNETYLSHLKFAVCVGLSLMGRGIVFIMHGLIPMLTIPERLNIEATVRQLDKWNEHTKERMKL